MLRRPDEAEHDAADVRGLPMTTPFLAPNGERIVVIESTNRRVNTVIAIRERDGRASYSNFDIYWSRSVGGYYWHESGFGPWDWQHDPGTLVARKGGRVWVADGVRLVHKDWSIVKRKYVRIRPLTDALAAQNGYVIATRRPRNPFDSACGDTSCTWCDTCKDHLPEDSDRLCEHLSWCHDACEYTKPCGHEGCGY